MKQLPFADAEIQFLVKFYTPDPALLEEELTRLVVWLLYRAALVQSVTFRT